MTTRRDDVAGVPGRYGRDGGYCTSFYMDPAEDMVGDLMTQRLWGPAYQAIDD